MAVSQFVSPNGILHITAFEEGTGLSAADQKGVSVGAYMFGANDYEKFKVIKCDFMLTCHKTNGRFLTFVQNESESDTNKLNVADFEASAVGSFPIHAGNFNANYDILGGYDAFHWKRTWKPKKMAINGNQEFGITLDPTDFSITWQFSLGIHALLVAL